MAMVIRKWQAPKPKTKVEPTFLDFILKEKPAPVDLHVDMVSPQVSTNQVAIPNLSASSKLDTLTKKLVSGVI